MKKEAMKFLAGVAVGAGTVIAANKFFETDQGRKVKEKMQKTLGDFYGYIYPKLKMIKSLTKMKYKQMVITAAIEYGKAKKLSDEAVKNLAEKTIDMWDDLMEKID